MAVTWEELIEDAKQDKDAMAFAKAVIRNAKNFTRQGKANLLRELRDNVGEKEKPVCGCGYCDN